MPPYIRVLKLTYPTDFGGIVLDGWTTTEMGTESLRQTVEALTSADFRPVCKQGFSFCYPDLNMSIKIASLNA